MNYEEAINVQYGQKNLIKKIQEVLKNEGIDTAEMIRDVLAPIEELHLLGSVATLDLARKVGLNEKMKVLDVGCGIGGPARNLVLNFGCHVTGLDLSKEYCQAAELINEYVGLGEKIDILQGNALQMPFSNEIFDIVFVQHVLMNISDKKRFLSQIFRVLRPNGHLVVYTICAGTLSPIYYPVIWANNPDINFLLSAVDLRELICNCGFKEFSWEDYTMRVIEEIELQRVKPRPKQKRPINLGLIVMDPSLKWKNMVLNLKEERIVVIQGIFERELVF
ncbi:MAG: class I SAM-dependent methyltransferase [Candidatus Hermodarchaeota archaeon]